MTRHAGFVLRRFPLDVVRRCIAPGGLIVEIGQEIVAIIGEALWIYRHVAYGHILVGAIIALKRISTDKEGQVVCRCLEERIARLLADSDMAAVAAEIGDGVTDLAREIFAMNLVHGNIITANLKVTVLAHWFLWWVVAVSWH